MFKPYIYTILSGKNIMVVHQCREM